jgi:hypothetical protein
MNDEDKPTTVSPDAVATHPQSERDRELGLFLARTHAHQHGKPRPGPEDIGPVAFARLKPTMTREEKLDAIKKALASQGIMVKSVPNRY